MNYSRSSSFGELEGSLNDASFHLAFKALTGQVVAGAYTNLVDGIYLRQARGQSQILALIETGMAGTLLDPEAVDPDTGAALPVRAIGLERDGFRGAKQILTILARRAYRQRRQCEDWRRRSDVNRGLEVLQTVRGCQS